MKSCEFTVIVSTQSGDVLQSSATRGLISIDRDALLTRDAGSALFHVLPLAVDDHVHASAWRWLLQLMMQRSEFTHPGKL